MVQQICINFLKTLYNSHEHTEVERTSSQIGKWDNLRSMWRHYWPWRRSVLFQCILVFNCIAKFALVLQCYTPSQPQGNVEKAKWLNALRWGIFPLCLKIIFADQRLQPNVSWLPARPLLCGIKNQLRTRSRSCHVCLTNVQIYLQKLTGKENRSRVRPHFTKNDDYYNNKLTDTKHQ